MKSPKNLKDDLTPPLPKAKKRGKRTLSPEARARREQKVVNQRLAKLEQKRANTNSYITKARQKKNLLHAVDKALDGDTPKGKLFDGDIDYIKDTALEDLVADAEIIFQPNDGPQTLFFESNEREVLYGGAAGGGKSYALIVDAVRDAFNKNHRAIIFRRTLDELRELIGKSKDLYPQMYPGATWNKQESTWSFPSGATIWYTYLESDDDVRRYQGQAFNYIGFDELTQWNTPYAWDYLRSRLRTTDPTLKLFMRATTNPGGVGSHWVRKMFIDPAPAGDSFWATDIETGKVFVNPKTNEPLFKRRFIPAKLSDNPYLYVDGQYEANLLSLPEAQRKQLLEGSWDVVEGAAFPEFGRLTHVCQPFKIPDNWHKFRCADYGYRAPAAVLWIAVDYDGRFYVYRELYGAGMDAEVLADKVRDAELGERITYGVLDSAVWDIRGQIGPSVAEEMNKRGLRWRPASKGPGSRVAGKVELHKRMRVPTPLITRDAMGEEKVIFQKPMLQIFSTCLNLIRTLPTLPTDKHNPEDVDTDAEDHAYDALRYGVMSRPMKPDFGLVMPHQAVVSSRRVGATHGDAKFGY